MEFDVDVSGEDILSKNYTICISDKNKLIKGFKFDNELVNKLSLKYSEGQYRYKKSKKGKSIFKVRIYSIIIYYLFKSLNINSEISLNICRDFDGRESEIKENLKFFIGKLLGLSIDERFYFKKIDKSSNAHIYAYLMRRDIKNQMKTYININLEDIEKFLIK